MGLYSLLGSVLVLGGASYIAGMLPLSFNMSASRMRQLSALGTGLLLGAAMGVIIPEGIEAIYESPSASRRRAESHTHTSEPSTKIAVALLAGFTLMLAIEQLITPALSSHPSSSQNYVMAQPGEQQSQAGADDDVDLELELSRALEAGGTSKDPRMMTLGLVIHSLADGLALGAANALDDEPGANPLESSGLSLVVFLAIAIHKAPTALALTTTLLPQLPPRQLRQHLVAFCVASPLSALCTYLFLAFVGGGERLQSWTGLALMFSGGTFLYVATVLSALPAHSHGEPSAVEHGLSSSGLSNESRTTLVILGMFIPVVLSGLVGHGH